MEPKIKTAGIFQLRFVAICCCLAFTLCLVGCGSGGNPKSSNVLKNDDMTIEGIYLDESYAGSNANDDIKRLYIFADIKATSGTLDISSAGFKLDAARDKATDTLNSMDVIQKDTDSGRSLARLASSYTCTNTVTKITPGSSAKLLIPFNVPSYYLQNGASFSLSDSKGVSDGLKFGYDSIQDADSLESIAKSIDSEGYAAAMKAREDASPETAQDVKNRLNGYEYYLTMGGVSQKYIFNGDRFTAKSMGQESSGTYTVKNGYLACTQDSTGWVNWIPWEYSDKKENGVSIDIDELYVEK